MKSVIDLQNTIPLGFIAEFKFKSPASSDEWEATYRSSMKRLGMNISLRE